MDAQDVPLFVDTGASAPKPDLPFVERDVITAVVRNPRTGEYLCLRWKTVDWETLITGGIEENQSAEEAARMEVREETGYKSLRLIKELPPYHSKFFHGPKGVNRFAHFRCFLFELENDVRDAISQKELDQHEPLWLSREELESFRLPLGHRFVLNHAYEA